MSDSAPPPDPTPFPDEKWPAAPTVRDSASSHAALVHGGVAAKRPGHARIVAIAIIIALALTLLGWFALR